MQDLISRQAAIEAICKACSMEGDYHKCDGYPETSTWCDELVALRALPSADRPQGWIPCSERLPSIGEKVLVSTKKTCFVQVFKGIYSDPTRWLWEHNSIKKIDAWMPLPKPWKGATDGNK